MPISGNSDWRTNCWTSLDQAGIAVEIFDGVLPNPTFSVVQEGKDAALKHDCNCIIALGGGSVMDTARLYRAA
jgi:alcohol dehydrogenase